MDRGYTLVELVVVVAILAVLSAVCAPLLNQGFNSYFSSKNTALLQTNGLFALTFISQDLRAIRSATDLSVASSSALSFTSTNGDTISYQLVTNQLQRTSSTGAQTLINQVSQLTFNYYDQTGASTATLANIRYIQVNATLSNANATLPIQTLIALRNV